jgi:BirA family biotin operon repressor/biotin-[acetyl-CoA-carboxylase] ligase
MAESAVGGARETIPMSIDHIRTRLHTDRVGFHTYLFGEVGSTNAVLRRLAETGASEGTVVLAETQTLGRGRLGKAWYSPPGLNLYASVLFRPAIALSAVPVFAMATSLAVTDAAGAEGVAAAIKWPNDVLAGGRKVAGTLITYASAGDVVEYVIVGVGVNLNVDRAALAAGLGAAAEDATSLAEIARHPIDRNVFAATFLNALERWERTYRAQGPDALLAVWRERDALAGRLVEVFEPPQRYRARAIGIGADGRLVVDDEGGRRHVLTDAEIRFATAPRRD